MKQVDSQCVGGCCECSLLSNGRVRGGCWLVASSRFFSVVFGLIVVGEAKLATLLVAADLIVGGFSAVQETEDDSQSDDSLIESIELVVDDRVDHPFLTLHAMRRFVRARLGTADSCDDRQCAQYHLPGCPGEVDGA